MLVEKHFFFNLFCVFFSLMKGAPLHACMPEFLFQLHINITKTVGLNPLIRKNGMTVCRWLRKWWTFPISQKIFNKGSTASKQMAIYSQREQSSDVPNKPSVCCHTSHLELHQDPTERKLYRIKETNTTYWEINWGYTKPVYIK